MFKKIYLLGLTILLIVLFTFPAYGQKTERDLSGLNWYIAQELRVIIEAFKIGLDCPIPKMHEDTTSNSYSSNNLWDGCPILGSFSDPMTSGYGIREDFIYNPIARSTDGSVGATFLLEDSLSSWAVTIIDGGGDDLDTITTVTDSVSGALILRCNDADNDAINIQLKGRPFKLKVGKRLWYETRVATKHRFTENDYMFGLTVTDTEPFGAVTDGVYFIKSDADTVYDCVSENNTVAATNVVRSGTMAAADTLGWHRYGFNYNGVDKVSFYYDGSLCATVSDADSICSDEAMSPFFSVRAGEAATVWEANLLIDYLFIVAER